MGTVNKESASQASSDLPEGWFAAVDESTGDTYYCNEATGETSWELPTQPLSNNQNENNDSLPPGWFAVPDQTSGERYYCNEKTGETTWDKPTQQDNSVYEDDSVSSSQ